MFFFAVSLGGVWGGNKNSLFYFTPDKKIIKNEIKSGVDRIKRITNNYFIGANSEGLLEIEITNNEWKINSYNTQNDLATARILGLYIHNDKIWLGHEGGFGLRVSWNLVFSIMPSCAIKSRCSWLVHIYYGTIKSIIDHFI